MFGINSPIEDAYHQAVYNRLVSAVYSALNQHVAPDDRMSFRKDWSERGANDLAKLLLQCARADWESYPEAFWIYPWIAELFLRCEPDGLLFVVSQWLEDQPLPPLTSEDPQVENQKVKHLKELFSALNR